jgi:hypothetical protein
VAIAVKTAAGARLEASNATGEPATDLAQQETRLRAKFAGLASPVIGRGQAMKLADALLALDAERQVRAVTALAVPDSVLA